MTGERLFAGHTLPPVGHELHVNTADLHAVSSRWGLSVGDLHEVAAPSGLWLSCQASAAAVDAAHGEVAAFMAGLAGRVGERAAGVVTDSASYLAQEAASAATTAQQVTGL